MKQAVWEYPAGGACPGLVVATDGDGVVVATTCLPSAASPPPPAHPAAASTRTSASAPHDHALTRCTRQILVFGLLVPGVAVGVPISVRRESTMTARPAGSTSCSWASKLATRSVKRREAVCRPARVRRTSTPRPSVGSARRSTRSRLSSRLTALVIPPDVSTTISLSRVGESSYGAPLSSSVPSTRNSEAMRPRSRTRASRPTSKSRPSRFSQRAISSVDGSVPRGSTECQASGISPCDHAASTARASRGLTRSSIAAPHRPCYLPGKVTRKWEQP